MIADSIVMKNMVNEMSNRLSLKQLESICVKIEKYIDLNDEQVVLNMSKIINPHIRTKNQTYVLFVIVHDCHMSDL